MNLLCFRFLKPPERSLRLTSNAAFGRKTPCWPLVCSVGDGCDWNRARKSLTDEASSLIAPSLPEETVLTTGLPITRNVLHFHGVETPISPFFLTTQITIVHTQRRSRHSSGGWKVIGCDGAHATDPMQMMVIFIAEVSKNSTRIRAMPHRALLDYGAGLYSIRLTTIFEKALHVVLRIARLS